MARPRQTVTIRHVAAEAGVSLQTVSRVMNDEPNVRQEMKDKVRAAVKKLGYVPSLAARRLSGSRSYMLLSFHDRDRTIEGWQLGEGSDYIDQMLYGGMLKCAEHGYRLLIELVDTHAENVAREIAAALAAVRPDGVILTPPHSDNPVITALLAEHGVPFARIGSDAGGAGFPIRMDDQAAGEAATRHLIDFGHRRIGFITGDPEYRLSEERASGYRAAMAAAGIATDPAWVVAGDFGYESGERAASELLSLAQPVTAIVASSEQMALATLHVARGRGLKIPRDLSIVSFDDTPGARHAMPPLTAINQPIAKMAERAADLLIAASAGQDVDGDIRILPFGLVARESTAPHGG